MQWWTDGTNRCCFEMEMIVGVSNIIGVVLLRCWFATCMKFVNHERFKLFPNCFQIFSKQVLGEFMVIGTLFQVVLQSVNTDVAGYPGRFLLVFSGLRGLGRLVALFVDRAGFVVVRTFVLVPTVGLRSARLTLCVEGKAVPKWDWSSLWGLETSLVLCPDPEIMRQPFPFAGSRTIAGAPQ